MPTYEFHHGLPLKASQKAQLARVVTDWHATTFRAPRFIVNCRFINTRDVPEEDNYIGGKPLNSNKLFISLRSGTGRTEEQYQNMTRTLQRMWDEAVQESVEKGPERELKNVFVFGTIDSAFERGWFLPMFENWVEKNTAEFHKEADAGDHIFKDWVEEIRERPEFQ